MKLTIEQWGYVMTAIRIQLEDSRRLMEEYANAHGKYNNYLCKYEFSSKYMEEEYNEFRDDWLIYQSIMEELKQQKF